MIPYLLAAVGGYLLGDSMKGSESFANGGSISKAKKFVRIQKLANQQIDKNGRVDDKTMKELEEIIDSLNSYEAELAIEMWQRSGEKMAQGGILSFFKPRLNEDEKKQIIGTPIKIELNGTYESTYESIAKSWGNTKENFEIAENDFPEKMSFKDAIKHCKLLGDGWRLPTIAELESMEYYICQKLPINQLRYDESITKDLEGLEKMNFKPGLYWTTLSKGDYKTFEIISWPSDGRAEELDAAYVYDLEIVRNGFLRRGPDNWRKTAIENKNYVRAIRSI